MDYKTQSVELGGKSMCRLFTKKDVPLPKNLKKFKKELMKKSKFPTLAHTLSSKEQALVDEIKAITVRYNVNNITRTMSYLDFYQRNPEIHWSFLAHMVSRNAGWNMTDLKGEFLPRLLSDNEVVNFFDFIERGNWLIFQDAFPQLLLYEKSKKTGRNLFYLLPYFNVSLFMEVMWNAYIQEQNSFNLTIALIINEQNYIESRVIKKNAFKEEVLNTFEFKMQDLLSMNHILFPSSNNSKAKLLGQTVHHFDSLSERISLGKRLYSILFSQHNLASIEKWAKRTVHTGSRKDFWPHLYNDIAELAPGSELKPRLNNCKLTKGSSRIFSPILSIAWKDQQHDPPFPGDWYKNWSVLTYLTNSEEGFNEGIEEEYCKTIERLEMVVISKKLIHFFDKV